MISLKSKHTQIIPHEQDAGQESSQVYTFTFGPSRGSFSKMLPESSSYYTSSTVEEWALAVSQSDEPRSLSDAMQNGMNGSWLLILS
jgi:hypothetical protein